MAYQQYQNTVDPVQLIPAWTIEKLPDDFVTQRRIVEIVNVGTEKDPVHKTNFVMQDEYGGYMIHFARKHSIRYRTLEECKAHGFDPDMEVEMVEVDPQELKRKGRK